MLDQIKTPKSTNEITLHKIVIDLMGIGEEPTLGEVLTEYERRVPLDPQMSRDNRRSTANKALRHLIDKGIIEAHGARIGLPSPEVDPRFTDLKPREQAVYRIVQGFALTGVEVGIGDMSVEYEKRFPRISPASDDPWLTALADLSSLINKGWLKMGSDGIVITHLQEPATPPKREVTLSELETALPELEELISAIKTINRWARVFEAIRKAG